VSREPGSSRFIRSRCFLDRLTVHALLNDVLRGPRKRSSLCAYPLSKDFDIMGLMLEPVAAQYLERGHGGRRVVAMCGTRSC
jgi:hypothetical protein